MVVRNERGIAIIWVAVSMVLILAFAAIAIDLSFLYTDKNYLHVSADSAVLAAANKISDPNDCAASSGSSNYPVRETAMEYAGFHSGGSGTGGAVTLNANDSNDPAGDIVLGHYTRDGDPSTDDLTPCQDAGGTPVNAVRVRARRDDAPSFFGGIFGAPIGKVGAYATAVAEPRANLPICVPSCIATNSACAGITMQPETGENAAWTGFFGGTSEQDILSLVQNPQTIPCTNPAGGGAQINMGNGLMTPVLQAIKNAYNANQVGGQWCVNLPTCNSACDTPPNECTTTGNYGTGSETIDGSAVFCITNVIKNGPNKGIYGSFSTSATGTPVVNCSFLAE
jgi:hypothetical protein